MFIAYDYDLTGRNTFHMKVKCACFVEYDSAKEFVEFVEEEKRREAAGEKTCPKPYFCIGGGSNLLFTEDFPGTVLHAKNVFLEVVADNATQALVRVGSGMSWDAFCSYCAENYFWGPENLSKIPGDVGAAVVQNIGAYGAEAGDLVNRVECYDLENGKLVDIAGRECRFGYRSSIFKTEAKGRYVVLSVLFNLTREYSPNLKHLSLAKGIAESVHPVDGELYPQQVRNAVKAIRAGKLPDPAEIGSAGSFFKNPYVSAESLEKIRSVAAEKDFGDVPCYVEETPQGTMYKIPAAWMIEKCGWKGHREGNVGVYEKQPLVIVNLTGNAVPEEVVSLEEKIVRSVHDMFGVTLSPEVEHVGA